MEFVDKYEPTTKPIVTTDEKTGEVLETTKVVLSDDAYAIGEMIELLMNEVRISRGTIK